MVAALVDCAGIASACGLQKPAGLRTGKFIRKVAPAQTQLAQVAIKKIAIFDWMALFLNAQSSIQKYLSQSIEIADIVREGFTDS